MLLSMIATTATHYHTEKGKIVEVPPPVHDPIVAMLTESDKEVWRDVTGTTNKKLEANRKRSTDLMNAARLQGALPSKEALQSLAQDRPTILKGGLEELRNRISAEGWEGIERFMKNTGSGVMIQMAAPPK
jgi:hypothetical protein